MSVVVEFLEAAVHHLLHARGLYPKELFEPVNVCGARCMKARHPDLEAYVFDALNALRGPIAAGDVKRVVLVVKDGGSNPGEVVERFTFDFLLHLASAEKPSRADVDDVTRAFGATISKISFLDALLPPLPAGSSRCTFEIVAYATRAGVSRELGTEAWTEEKVGLRGLEPESGSAGGGGGAEAGIGYAEPAPEFSNGCAREVVPVKSTCTNIVNLDLFVERRRDDNRGLA